MKNGPSHPQVVRIFANTQEPDFDCPWQALAPESSTGSGVIVGRRHILTGAHVVANATFLQVQKQADPNKIVARVRSICHDADLALLEVEDQAFTDDITPAKIGELPDFSDRVSVVGFPIGGEEISVTEGVVSRLELQTYDHSQRRLLAITIDAAINAGNSGGPVFQAGAVVGIAFQKLGEGENIGEVVPATLIKRFLKEAFDHAVVSIPGLGLRDQGLESPSLRRHLGLSEAQSGVLIRRVGFGSSAFGALQAGDVLMKIAGLDVANNGTVRYRDRYRTHYRVFLGECALGQKVEAMVFRAGQEVEVPITLKAVRYLVPRSQYDVLPSYFVWGGLVFQRLTRDFLNTWEDWDARAPTSMVAAYAQGLPSESKQELVVLSRVLADELTMGMEAADCEIVTELNGEPVRDLAHLAAVLDEAEGVVELRTDSEARVALRVDDVHQARTRILERYKIPADRSINLTAGGPAAANAAATSVKS